MANPMIRFKRDNGTEYPDWEATAFEDAFTAIGNNTLSRAELSGEGTVRNVHYGDILTVLGSIVDPVADNLPFIADETKAKKYQSHILQDGDVIFADTAEDDTVGKAVEMKNCGSPVVSGLHTTPCRPVERLFEHGYLGYYLNAPAYHNQLRPLMQGIKVTSVSRTAMNETELNHPTSPEEQQKIAALFTELDNLISATSDEVSALEEAKKGMMQKIFSREVRFKRDDGTEYPEWEETSLGKLFCKVNERNNGQFDKTKWISVAKMYYQEPDKVTSNNIDTRTYVMRFGDMAFEGHPNKEFMFGRFVVNDIGDGVISELFPIYRHITAYVLNYWKYAIQVESIMAPIYRCAITASGNSSNKLDNEDFLSEVIPVPSLEEQQKIADFLSNFDEAIVAAKDELAGYNELKKGLLQRMFT